MRVNGPNSRILMATITVPAETLVPGPIGYRVQVVDYDSSARRFYGAHVLPAKLEDEPDEWRKGNPKIVDDYRFHAQNVYACVMKTLARFEFALGRRVGWSFDTHQLKVAPHGMRDANAFYSPREEGLVFGYFPGQRGLVFTSLSHDVIVHETTHALIDALRQRYMDPSSPDQAALHEGFADVIALLSIFAQHELIQQLLVPGYKERKSPALIKRADVAVEKLKDSALLGLAEQMGEEIQNVRGAALRRSARLKADPTLLDQPQYREAHRRGEIFAAAVMNGFLAAWSARIESSGVPDQDKYPLAHVAEAGADVAEALVTMWIRALDYMPPVHVEFSDALSAALTSDLEVRPDDSRFELRRYILESFASYGIKPASLSKDPLGVWERAPGELRYDRVRFKSMRNDRDEVFRFLWDNRDVFWDKRKSRDLERAAYSKVLSVRPCVRTGVDGFILRETVAEYYQVARLTPDELRQAGFDAPKEYLATLRREQDAGRARRRPAVPAEADAGNEEDRRLDLAEAEADAEEKLTTPLYGGGTLIFDEYGRLKYHVHNDLFEPKRQTARLQYLWEAGLLRPGRDGATLRPARLSTLHRLRAIDARRFPKEDW